MTKSSVAVVARGNGRGAEGTGNGTGSPMCKNCHTLTTPLWRRNEHGAVLCNACGLFLKLHGRSRPISLKTDVIKSRNRKSSHANSGAAGDSPSAEYRKKENKKRKTQSSRELHAAETLETLMRNDAGSANAVAPVAAAAAAGSASSATEPAPAASSGPGSVGSSSGTNSGSNAKPTISHAWRKILPLNQTQPTSSSNSQTQPVNHSQAQPANQGQPQNSMPRTGGGLPHLSMLLGSVNSSIPHSNFPPRPDEQPSLQPSSLDPEILDDKQQQQQTSSSGPPSRPSATAPQLPSQFPNRTMPSANNVNSNSPLPPALPLTSSALARQDHEQTQPLHMASINEILNNQKPKSEKSLSAVGSPNLHPNFPSAPAPHINTPNIKPLASTVNGAQAGPMRRYSSEYGASGAPRQMQTNSHYSTSPPPIDLHQNLPSAAPYTSSTRSLVPQSQKHQRQASSEIPTTTSSDDERRRNEDNENTQFRLQLRQQRDQQNNAQLHDLRVSRPSSNESLQMQPPLMKLLQSQEEVIKLKTRISELELVTDLYKRHIFELDAKCRSLEERLG